MAVFLMLLVVLVFFLVALREFESDIFKSPPLEVDFGDHRFERVSPLESFQRPSIGGAIFFGFPGQFVGHGSEGESVFTVYPQFQGGGPRVGRAFPPPRQARRL